ncbi:MAG: leucine-rich repeat protein [Bacteroidales bacterium]|nr:leucine-rich repeat protein [Candidatus Scybalousia scybalohippi]
MSLYIGNKIITPIIIKNNYNPDSTTVIEGQYEKNWQIVSIDLTDITTIGKDAFNQCASLTSVIMDSVITIGERAFASCPALKNITIPSTCERIGDNAFQQFHGTITINKPQGSISGSPWGAAEGTTIVWEG